MYHIAVYFDVQPEHRQDFIDAAIKDGIDSGANEPGTLRFELIQDETDPNRFYLNEGYESLDAFEVHAGGPYFKEFFDAITPYVEGPTWLIKGNRVEA
ncbi:MULTISPECIES: putative quinol monooxygenase [unclassified Kribbella]|uniref:putative quinol monooxygenase n=1 Tax=unclassified Kribbella TaxID=2644121 RepID=UPI0033CE9C65